MTTLLDETVALLRRMVDDAPCRLDYEGRCQTHNLDAPCPVADARELLARIEAAKEGEARGDVWRVAATALIEALIEDGARLRAERDAARARLLDERAAHERRYADLENERDALRCRLAHLTLKEAT